MDGESDFKELQDEAPAGESAHRERRRLARSAVPVGIGVTVLVVLLAGLIVALTMGTGGPEVPDLIGLSYDEAGVKVKAVGLSLEIDPGQDSSVECGDLRILAQDPKPGTAIESDETVTVILEGLQDSPEYSHGSAGTLPLEPLPDEVEQESASTAPAPTATQAPAGRRICLDPGHSGRSGSETDPLTGLNVGDNTGATGERQSMWELAGRVRTVLEQAGYTVSLTKPSADAYASLRERADIGNGCDVVIRLHFDDSGFTGVMRAPVGAARCPESDPGRITVIDPGVARASDRLAVCLAAPLGLSVRDDTGGTSMGNSTPPGYPTALIGSVLSRVPVVCIENRASQVQGNPAGQEQVAAQILEGVNSYFR